MIDLPGIVLQRLGTLPTLEMVAVADPDAGEVRVRLVASGICHTDISYMRDALTTLVLLGHEGTGVVEQIGADVTQVAIGDHVVINWQVKCGKCRRCVSGRQDLCENIRAAPAVTQECSPLSHAPAYIAFCQALAQGNYAEAKQHAERKLGNLAE